jgi:hypothetical protein
MTSPEKTVDWKPQPIARSTTILFFSPYRITAIVITIVLFITGILLGIFKPWLQTSNKGDIYTPSADTLAIRAHVESQLSYVQQNASGQLLFPYLIPQKDLNALFDWDSVFLGIGTSRYPSTSKFFIGSMKNFLSNVSLITGEVRGLLFPSGGSSYLSHAKPILIWGAYLAARSNGNDYESFRIYDKQMLALLNYWERIPRIDPINCSLWYDMAESGADNLAYAPCSADSMSCWNSTTSPYAVATPDLPVFRERQATAYALFTTHWAKNDEIIATKARNVAKYANSILKLRGNTSDLFAVQTATLPTIEAERATSFAKSSAERATAANLLAERVRNSVNNCLNTLWLEQGGYSLQLPGWTARNQSSGLLQQTRTYQLAWPLWGSIARGESSSRIAAAVDSILKPDMVAIDSGLIRSLSSLDPLYTNVISIPGIPGSNWRGPSWIPYNVILAYSLATIGRLDTARSLAQSILRTLANDLEKTGTWHENYNTDNVSNVMGDAGFLSFNTLAVDLEQNLYEGIDPFALY